MLIWPDAVFPGTVVAIEVVPVTAIAGWDVALNLRLLLAAVGSKFVPVIVTAVPETPMFGVTLVILRTEATTNGFAEVALPFGAVTVIGPVAAPEGTVATIWLAVDDVTLALEPLKVTAFWLAVVLKPVPLIVTVVPADPDDGENPITLTWPGLIREIERMFPTAS